MSRILAALAASALLTMLALPAPASAADRADGLRIKEAAVPTEFSSHRRAYRRHVVVRRAWRPRYAAWGPGYGYRGPRYAYGPRYAWGPGYGYWGGHYAYAGYPYYYRPRPAVSFSIGFGPRWWW